MIDKAGLDRAGVHYVLERMPPLLRASLLQEGSLARIFDLGVKRTQTLAEGLVIDRSEMFDAFRRATDGSEPTFITLGRRRRGTVTIDADGAGIVTVGKKQFRFDNADLLASDRMRRMSAVDRIVASCSLSIAQEDQLRSLLDGSPSTSGDLDLALNLIDAAPEVFARQLRTVLNNKTVSVPDLVPVDPAHWYALLPAPTSDTLEAYVAKELEEEWQTRLDRRPLKQTLQSMALTFAGPAILPTRLFENIEPAVRLEMLSGAKNFADPFALAGCAQLAAKFLPLDPQMEPLGLAFLERLVGEPTCTENGLDIYGVVFLLAVTFLRQHEVLRERPAYWRRLAASAQASLVVQCCGLSTIKQKDLLQWAWNRSGPEYVFTMACEASELPRWLPGWIDTNHLMADIFGRILALAPAGDLKAIPAAWGKNIEKATEYLKDRHNAHAAIYPAILEAGLPVHLPTREDLGELIEFFDAASNHPTTENFVRLQPITNAYGYPPGFVDVALSILDGFLESPLSPDHESIRDSLEFASTIAVQLRDRTLANRVVQVVLTLGHLATGEQVVLEAIIHILRCSQVGADRAEGVELAAKRLDRLAGVLKGASLLRSLHEHLAKLASVDPTLWSRLGRALARSRLGSHG